MEVSTFNINGDIAPSENTVRDNIINRGGAYHGFSHLGFIRDPSEATGANVAQSNNLATFCN